MPETQWPAEGRNFFSQITWDTTVGFKNLIALFFIFAQHCDLVVGILYAATCVC